MECGKLTAKLRDAVPVCFMVGDQEVKRYRNIEIPEDIEDKWALSQADQLMICQS